MEEFNNYIPCHVHSDFSFNDSVAKIDDLTAKAKFLGMPGLVLSDHGNICGWLKFYESCKRNNLKAIFGEEFYVADDALLPSKIDERIEQLELHEKESYGPLFEFVEYSQKSNNIERGVSDDEDQHAYEIEKEYQNKKLAELTQENLLDKNNNFDAKQKIEKLKELKNSLRKSNHLIILAKNKTGYNNIIKLSSFGYLQGFFYKPRIDLKILEQHKEGLIVLSACLGGQISQNIIKGNIEKAEWYVREYKRVFGEDFYLELQLHEIEEQKTANKKLIEFAKKYNIETVITQDVHYVEKEDVELHEIIIKLRKKEKDKIETKEEIEKNKLKVKAEEVDDKDDSDGYFYSTKSLYFKSLDELKESWKKDHNYITEEIFNKSIQNTKKIFDKVENISVRNEKPLLPEYDTKGLSPRKFILNLIKEGAKQKLYPKIGNNKELQSKYEVRMKEELDTICDLNFEQYFLVEWDFIKWAKDNDINVGPGRGSCCGSLIAYLLSITDLDPIEHDLLFSRFINKSRSGAIYKIEMDFELEKN